MARQTKITKTWRGGLKEKISEYKIKKKIDSDLKRIQILLNFIRD